MPLEPGAQATVEDVVRDEMTALALGSGDVPVLGTPALIALCERAAVAAVAGALAAGQTTVGASIRIDHLAPTPVGAAVRATARLEQVDGRRLTFAIEAGDGAGPIARGTHGRVIVDRDGFLGAAERRA